MAVKDLVRIILFLINAVTVVFGLAITAVGVYVISQSKTEPFKDIETGNLVGCVAFILIIGILVFLIGSFGCFGSLTQNTRLINWYMLSISIVALLQLICLVALLINKSKVIPSLQYSLNACPYSFLPFVPTLYSYLRVSLIPIPIPPT